MKISEKLPLTKYTGFQTASGRWEVWEIEPVNPDLEKKIFYSQDELETLLANLGRPENLNKIIKMVMFGKSEEFNLGDLLK